MPHIRCNHCNGSLMKSEDGPECINCGRPYYRAAAPLQFKRVYLPGVAGPRRTPPVAKIG